MVWFATDRTQSSLHRTARKCRFELLEPRHLLAAQPIISEFLASNDNVLLDDNGNSSDWIEIYNAGDESVNLAGYALSDNPSDNDKWVFPSVLLQPQQFLVVFAATDLETTQGSDLYTGFNLSASGEYVGLFNPVGEILSEFGVAGSNYPPQQTDVSYGYSYEMIAPSTTATLVQPLEFGYLLAPTPGGPNGTRFLGFVENVSFGVERGFYDEPISVSITTPTVGAEVYYTTDASIPSPDNPNATFYAGPVTVDRTTTLRAAAYLDDFAPSYIDTQTYVFLSDILLQDPRNDYGNGVSPNNGQFYPEIWEGNTLGDYAINPQIASDYDDDNPANSDFGIRESLLALPTISLTLEHDDAFGPLSNQFPGIVINAVNRGEAFRHAASVEYFDPATGDSFQANVAVQSQGNTSRANSLTRKHSYRVIFNGTLGGPNKLDFPLFDNSEFADINTFTLKAASTDGFTSQTFSDSTSIDSTLTRDTFMRQLQFETSGFAVDSSFSHVYINGLYWGIYNLIERPDDAFFSDRFGGNREDWDILRDNRELLSGNEDAFNELRNLSAQIAGASPSDADALYQQLQGNYPDGTNDPNTEALLDTDSYIDYIIVHFLGTANDWPRKNWYAGRNRVEPGNGFRFFVWDQDQSLVQSFSDRTNSADGAGEFYQQLRKSPEFSLRFADRVQQHFFNNGVLTLTALQQTWENISDRVEPAIVAETARWGDVRAGNQVTPYIGSDTPPQGAPLHPSIPANQTLTVPEFTIDHWRTSNDYVRQLTLPFAWNLFFDRLIADELLLEPGAPTFQIDGAAQHGGAIVAGSGLSISAPEGQVFFTIDGSDPRAIGGGVVGVLYADSIELITTTVVKARSLVNGKWSALSEATFNSADFDSDLDVDGADFLAWQRGYGSLAVVHADGDANIDGAVTSDDLGVWKATYGIPVLATAAIVPASSQPAAFVTQVFDTTNPPTNMSGSLIDLAMAIAWLGEATHEEDALIVARETSVEATLATDSIAADLLVVIHEVEDFETVKAVPDDIDVADRIWLADNLLERMFA